MILLSRTSSPRSKFVLLHVAIGREPHARSGVGVPFGVCRAGVHGRALIFELAARLVSSPIYPTIYLLRQNEYLFMAVGECARISLLSPALKTELANLRHFPPPDHHPECIDVHSALSTRTAMQSFCLPQPGGSR